VNQTSDKSQNSTALSVKGTFLSGLLANLVWAAIYFCTSKVGHVPISLAYSMLGLSVAGILLALRSLAFRHSRKQWMTLIGCAGVLLSCAQLGFWYFLLQDMC
jgi:hypothetical protein